ncbi:MAG: hypothetical protein SXA11_24825 [Cyanobacteriota bacterium]|nr:hypothetical protein [Cyanobacteriota bacterium]
MADLSGSWLGTYWQEENPTRFEATLLQTGNALTGNILDDNYLGEASISGEVIGRRVSFTKRYLTRRQGSIYYTGTISEDEDFIQGQWEIGAIAWGTWEARRSGQNLMADLQQRLAKELTLSAGKK